MITQRLNTLVEGAGLERRGIRESACFDLFDALGNIDRFELDAVREGISADCPERRGQCDGCQLLAAVEEIGRQLGDSLGNINGFNCRIPVKSRKKRLGAFGEMNSLEFLAVIEWITAARERSGKCYLCDSGVRESVFTDFGQTLVESDIGEHRTAIKRVVVDCGYVLGNGDFSQSDTAGKSAVGNRGHTLADGDACKVLALIEHIAAHFGNGVGNDDGFQRAHLAQGIISELGYGVGNSQLAQGIVVLKHIVGDRGDSLAKGNGFQQTCLCKRFLRPCYGRWDVDFGNGRACQKAVTHSFKTLIELDLSENRARVEGSVTERLDGRGNFDRLQRTAIVKGKIADRCDGGREVNLLEQVTVIEGVVSDFDVALGEGNTHNVVIVFKCRVANFRNGLVSDCRGNAHIRCSAIVMVDSDGAVILSR